jgi:hypothetical protein
MSRASKRQKRSRSTSSQRRRSAALPSESADDGATLLDAGGSNGPDLDTLWQARRQGSRNVAGVTFQVAVTAELLVAGRVGAPGSPNVSRVVPEGFEDVDCDLQDGRRLLVQAKERGSASKPLGMADLAAALVHAAQALRTGENELDIEARFVLVTDGNLGTGVPETGWTRTVTEFLVESGDEGAERLRALTESVAQLLVEAGQADAWAAPLVALTSVVHRPWHLRLATEQVMCVELGLHPAVANLVYARLVNDLSQVAAEQRDRQRASAAFRSTGDLDALITRVQSAVDLDALEQATRDGIAEPVDYLTPALISEAEFLAGVDVTPAHVAAGLDVPRIDELAAILGGLSARGHVIISGPSGSGKSALMWRAARDVGRGARPTRVLRCSSTSDVALLVRHARLQQPTAVAPLLVCADDLGRDSYTHWAAARDQLLEIPGVLVLATVRREDFTPELAGDATVVDPRLSQASAEAVYQRLATNGVPLAVEPEEAISRADGLLMEFIAIATTGNRLETVLSAQVARLAEPGRRVQRRCLRLVTAAHTLGSAVPADALGRWLTKDGNVTTDDVSDALAILADEHLLRPQADGSWRGLHDLRTEVLVRLLHMAPPPTLAVTFAEVLPLLPPGRRGFAMRRAAERIAREALRDLDVHNPQQVVDQLSELFLPVADAAGQILATLPVTAAGAMQAADLLDGSLRADAAIFAAACLEFLALHQPPNGDLQNIAFVTFGIRNAGVRMPDDIPAGRRLNELGLQLPERSMLICEAVAGNLTSGRLAELATACSHAEALVLLEAAEASTVLTPADGVRVWSHHVPTLPEPPGADFDQPAADRRARLAATLVANGALRGVAASDILGPLSLRAADAVAADPDGLNVATELVQHDPSEDTHSVLIRRETFAPGELLVAHASKLATSGDAATESAYPPLALLKGDGSINDQAVILARRLFDACPEVDRVDVAVLQANLQLLRYTAAYGVHEDGEKRLRRGVLRREADVRFNVACMAAVHRLLAAGSWSERLRQQAIVASDLVALLSGTLIYLRTYRNPRQVRSLSEQAQRAAATVARLPLRPIETVAGESWTQAVSGSHIDDRDRESDRAQVVLSKIADAAVQLAAGLADQDSAGVVGAGWRLLDAPAELREARADGAPAYSGIGDTLPPRFDELAKLIGEVVMARQARLSGPP